MPTSKWHEGLEVEFDGDLYTIVRVHMLRRKGGRRTGYVRALATQGGEDMHARSCARCKCAQPTPEFKAVDLVTETKFVVCAQCNTRKPTDFERTLL